MAINDIDYASTLTVTDVVNSGTNSVATAVDNTGMSQGALYTLLNSIITNWNLLLVKVKADGANSTYSGSACTTLASRGISNKGMYQKDLIAALVQLETAFNAVLTLLDADTQVTKDNYIATVNALGTGAALDLNNTVSGSLGLDQDKLVKFLDDLVTKFNGLLAHLDTDAV